MKILHIVGNRPQFIKLAMLQKALNTKGMPGIILHTGQHFDREMSGLFFEELDIPDPHYTLGINQKSHNEMIGRMLCAIDPLLKEKSPDWVVVYGDTNSTLAGALAARKRDIPVLHVESGVRTGDDSMPEESNRVLADRIARINCCSSFTGIENLQKEGYFGDSIGSQCYFTGDLMLDAALHFGPIAANRPVSTNLALKSDFVLATIHRAENLNQPETLKAIIEALNVIHDQVEVVMPLHPKTRALIEEAKIPVSFKAVGPLGYLDMLALVQLSQAIITDSGGLSREAYFFKKPSLIIMKHPFWPELQESGRSLRSDADRDAMTEKFKSLMRMNKLFRDGIFGEGHAAETISNLILQNA